MVQLQHKVLQSYLVAEGLFDECVVEDSQCTFTCTSNTLPLTSDDQ